MNVFSISKELKISRPYQFWTKLRICPNKKDQTSEEQGHDPIQNNPDERIGRALIW
jgi:hypothetical protein